jgi:hypothetical protein
MESNYHTPDPFRYSVNSFIRSVKEIPLILRMELQNDSRYAATFKPFIDSLGDSELLSVLFKNRDFLVHRGMLNIASTGIAGTTEGKGIKVATGFRVEPYQSTLEAYENFKAICRSSKIIRNTFGPDCDSWPIIRREWRIPDLKGELLEVAIFAWQQCGEVLSEVTRALGEEPLDQSFRCRQDLERVKTRAFSREEFILEVDGIK